jgi:lipoprotein NlpD
MSAARGSRALLRVVRAAVTLSLCLALAACYTQERQADTRQYYTVREGDTLYSIAFRHSLDYHDLARWNHIDNPALIYPGRRLQLFPPGSASNQARTSAAASRTTAAPKPATPPKPAGPPIGWSWPASGDVVARFGDPSSIGKGIDIGGRVGDEVRAAAAGRVVYTGSGLIGYGKLVIIKHNDSYLSAYGHNDALFVEQGAEVKAGQRVATMGEGPGKRPLLHFEIRVDGKPVDPLLYLPSR